MATGSLKKQRSTFVAALLVVGAIAVPLVAWFFTGWADVRGQQRILRTEPVHAADVKAAQLASELRSELARLVVREAERPYFHYQNLFHDPRTGTSLNVSTSPLATGPQDPLVLGYFHIDKDNKLSTPTINDEAPHLSESTRLAENRRFRDEVVRSFAGQLRVTDGKGELVAEVTPPKKQPVKRPVLKRIEPRQPEEEMQQQRTQVVQLDEQSYAQNNAPNDVYWNYMGNQYRNIPSNVERSNTDNVQLETIARQQKAEQESFKVNLQSQKRLPPKTQETATVGSESAEGGAGVDASLPKNVTITISPFEWRTFPFSGVPSLVAVRHVATPDGTLSQGFVIDRSTLTSWLATRAGEHVAELVVKDDGPNEIAPGWQLTVAANPLTLVEAGKSATKVASAFLIKFVILGLIAAMLATFVVALVARAERFARERSQFAAAAAHELRTPLAGLQLYGDMLADGLGDPGKLRDYARRMSEEASRLGRVVSNVLGFSQLERGNLSVDVKSGPLGQVIAELAERAEPALDRAGAMLALDVSPDLRANYDRDAVIRIIGNLLDNAEKYGRAAEDRTIELTAKETDTNVEVVVHDHGPGVSEEGRAKLFKVFSRGVDADGPAGLGLGLALSKSLAHAMGGELEYRPATSGATFVLRLPKAA